MLHTKKWYIGVRTFFAPYRGSRKIIYQRNYTSSYSLAERNTIGTSFIQSLDENAIVAPSETKLHSETLRGDWNHGKMANLMF